MNNIRRNQTTTGCANCKFYFNGDCTNFGVCKGSSAAYSTNPTVIDITLPTIELKTTRLDLRVSYIKQK